MKKIITLLLLCVCFLCGCQKESADTVVDNFDKKVNDTKSYVLKGNMEIYADEETFTYSIEVNYLQDNFYKAIMVNQTNNHEQIILRNSDAVYVITPSLNKSFKFQSDWPNNSSQAYLLSSIVKDMKNDTGKSITEENNQFIIKSSVNYPNNPNLVKEKITLDKDLNLKEVKVLSKDNIPYIIFTVSSLDKKAIFADNYFLLETISKNLNEKTTTEEDAKTTLKIDEALFPLYLPSNTSLKNRETIKTDVGERVIMTFAGDNPFILVQETVTREKEFTTIPTSGSPYLLVDTVGALTNGSYTWISNGIEYYIVSDVMEQNELLEVAKSINAVPTINEK